MLEVKRVIQHYLIRHAQLNFIHSNVSVMLCKLTFGLFQCFPSYIPSLLSSCTVILEVKRGIKYFLDTLFNFRLVNNLLYKLTFGLFQCFTAKLKQLIWVAQYRGRTVHRPTFLSDLKIFMFLLLYLFLFNLPLLIIPDYP